MINAGILEDLRWGIAAGSTLLLRDPMPLPALLSIELVHEENSQ